MDNSNEYKGYKIVRENEIQIVIELPNGEYDYVNKSMWTTLKEYVDNL